MTLDQGDNMVIVLVEFLVVDLPSAYNVIFNRPLMKKTSMVIVVCSLMVKFPTPTGIRYIKADQTITHQCHI